MHRHSGPKSGFFISIFNNKHTLEIDLPLPSERCYGPFDFDDRADAHWFLVDEQRRQAAPGGSHVEVVDQRVRGKDFLSFAAEFAVLPTRDFDFDGNAAAVVEGEEGEFTRSRAGGEVDLLD